MSAEISIKFLRLYDGGLSHLIALELVVIQTDIVKRRFYSQRILYFYCTYLADFLLQRCKFITSRVSGRGNVFVVSVCLSVCFGL